MNATPVTSSIAPRLNAAALARAWRRSTRLARLLLHVGIGAAVAGAILVGLRARRDPRAADAVTRWWVRGVLTILNVRLHVRGERKTGATLYVCNHISWLDIPCLRAAVDAAFVAKEEVRRWPVIGGMAAREGTLFLNRGERDGTTAVADAMTWMLKQRRAVVIFPEGTTSDGRELRRFHARLYQAAIRTHAHVQAVAIRYPHADGVHPAAPFVGEQTLMDHLWRLLAEPALDVHLDFRPVLLAAGIDRRGLADITRSQIVQSLGMVEEPRQRQAAR